ncbi:hypothetical protein N7453_001974 [Penicillium expansum]|nr:hypothetical protein N7453_001974 [Penicillium expansum]
MFQDAPVAHAQTIDVEAPNRSICRPPENFFFEFIRSKANFQVSRFNVTTGKQNTRPVQKK